MSVDVLFIVHDVYQEDNQFPLNIAYLSSILEYNGYTVEVYCMDVYHYTNDDLAKKLQSEEYKLIGVSFMAARFKETIIDICNTINKYKKDAWLVLGGHGPSPIPEYMLKTVNCDAVVVGEAEISILEILRDYSKNNNKKIYIGESIKKIDKIPFPAWHLFPMEKYISNFHWDKDDRTIQVLSSRGCINRCTFCYRMEKGIRLRSIDNLMEEMNILKDKYNVDTFQFQDELFLISKKRIEQFRKGLNGMDIKFTANARVDILNKNICKTLKDIGCILLNIGFESSSQVVLDYMKKNATVEQNIQALENLKEVGLITGLNFIWGYPPDNFSTLMNNVKLIKKYNQYYNLRTIRPVTAYPGCELYYEAIDKGLINGPEDFFNKFNNSDRITMNFTKYPDDTCYKWLLRANTDLIMSHFEHTGESMDNAYALIDQFKYLYEGKNISFRGGRHYNKGD